MGLLGWWKPRVTSRQDRRLHHWRHAWAAAASTADDDDCIARLRTDLDALGLAEDDIEIEREMLQALVDRQALTSAVRHAGLPVIGTGHRIVGSDECHFSAPVSMPDRPGQPAGRLLLTNCRAIFVGGAEGTATAWHAIVEVVPTGRDVFLVGRGARGSLGFRCNNFSDALCAVFIARELVESRRRGSGL